MDELKDARAAGELKLDVRKLIVTAALLADRRRLSPRSRMP